MADTNLLVLAREYKKLREEVKQVLQLPKGDTGAKGDKGDTGDTGPQGFPGRDGKDGINGYNGIDGRDGQNGQDGKDGLDGVGVQNAYLDFDNALVIVLSDGREINAGYLSQETKEAVMATFKQGASTINELLPPQEGNAGKYLTTDGTNTSWASIAAGGLNYQGTWNASTNTPTLASGVGSSGSYYIVATAGSTNLDGITDWQIGDWLLFNGTVWQKIDQSDLVTSVNGQTGAVSLSTTNISEGTNQYFTNARARSAVSAGTGISYNSSTGVITNASPDQTVALTGGGATTITGTYPNFTISSVNTTYGLATSTVPGLVELSSDTTQTVAANAVTATASRTYGLQLNAAAQAVVNVPWTDTTYSLATSTVLGLIELGSDTQQTVAANAVTAAASRTYALQVNAAGQGVVNVPWTDTNSGGTVTSVGGTGTVSGLSLSGTVTTSGNLTLGGALAVTPSDFASQTANTVLAAPNGSAGLPTFRALVAADVPTLNQNTTGTASNVTGTVAIANGGTGATTAAGALTNLGAYAASNPSGYITSSGTAANVTGIVAVANGGTGTATPSLVAGTNITISGTFPNQTINSTGGGGGSLAVLDEGTTLTSAATSLNFTGAGVTATNTGGAVTVNIAGGGGGGSSSPIPKLLSWSIGAM